MKALIVTGSDFAALHFENHFIGTPVEEIIAYVDEYQTEADMIEDAEEINLEVVDAGDVSPTFIKRLRSIEDYDNSKQKKFWMENEEI